MVSLEDIEEARVRLRDIVRETPVLYSESISAVCGRPVYLKCENLQKTGSYKVRGASNLISQLPPGQEVVAASAGNHAQGVALAARFTNRKATVFMPKTAALPKVEATRGYGADVRLDGANVDECLELAKKYADENGAALVPPFDDEQVIAGQGTVGLELLDQVPDLDVVVCAVGGGGLVSGVATAIKSVKPDAKVYGVEAEGAAAMRAALDAGKVVYLPELHTMADGIAVHAAGQKCLEHVQKYVDDVYTVTEEDICNAVVLLLERKKCVVEPAGAVGLAALTEGKIPGDGPVVVLLSGGNVDPLLLISLIDFGLNAAGRYLVMRFILDDRPGQLTDLASALSDMGLNIIDVEHHRAGLILGVREVEIRITVETRNPEHRHQVVEKLAAQGWRVELVR
jgi:threonine dehydratase